MIRDLEKRKIIIYFLILFMGLLFLSGSLEGVKFRTNSPIPGADQNLQQSSFIKQENLETVEIREGDHFVVPFMVLMGLGMILLFIRIVTNLQLRRGYKYLLGLGFLIILAILFNPAVGENKSVGWNQSNNLITPITFDYLIAPIGEPPSSLMWLTRIILMCALGLFVVWSIMKFQKSTHRIDPFIEQTEQALSAIASGVDLSDVIVRCYFQMGILSQEERQIKRENYLTPREFEMELMSKGFPESAVHNITALFEKVRYGKKELGQEDEMIAIAALSEIRQFCRKDRMSS